MQIAEPLADSSNSETVEVELLGTGTSTGVPVIGCRCAVCRSDNPRNKRLRCSAWVKAHGLSFVIDTSPDFRQQALRSGIDRLDAILYTHHHFDHVAGLDDTRPFFFDNPNPLPCYLRADTAELMKEKFKYVFRDRTYPGVPELELRTIDGPFEVGSRYARSTDDDFRPVPVIPIEMYHGSVSINGYRIGGFAYLTDTNGIPESSVDKLQGLEVLVIDGLRHGKHPTHFTIEEAVEFSSRIGVKQTYLTHITHTVEHESESAKLPEGVALAYDGLRFGCGL